MAFRPKRKAKRLSSVRQMIILFTIKTVLFLGILAANTGLICRLRDPASVVVERGHGISSWRGILIGGASLKFANTYEASAGPMMFGLGAECAL